MIGEASLLRGIAGIPVLEFDLREGALGLWWGNP